MAQKQKAVVLFSGGVDSTTCLALAIERFGKEHVVPLSIQYGQKHSKELEAAKNILAYYGIEGKTMDVTKLFAFSNSSLLTQSTEAVPTGSYKEQQDEHGEGPVSTYVPFRNGLFLSAAASLALSLDCGYIYYGALMLRAMRTLIVPKHSINPWVLPYLKDPVENVLLKLHSLTVIKQMW